MKKAIVTGAASGIGLELSVRLRKDNIHVITVDLSGDVDVHLDVSSSAQVQAFFKQHQDIDILVNSAGIAGANSSVIETDDAAWQRTLDVNLNGTFYMCRAVAAIMAQRGWGRIVNVASIAGKEGNQNQAAYSVSKSGVIALTKSLAKELAQSGVLVNVITPGLIESPMLTDMSAENLQRSLQKIPMGRVGRTEEVAELIVWLVSDKVSFSTGAVFDISGGRATY